MHCNMPLATDLGMMVLNMDYDMVKAWNAKKTSIHEIFISMSLIHQTM
jgi:hypothetical protein